MIKNIFLLSFLFLNAFSYGQTEYEWRELTDSDQNVFFVGDKCIKTYQEFWDRYDYEINWKYCAKLQKYKVVYTGESWSKKIESETPLLGPDDIKYRTRSGVEVFQSYFGSGENMTKKEKKQKRNRAKSKCYEHRDYLKQIEVYSRRCE